MQIQESKVKSVAKAMQLLNLMAKERGNSMSLMDISQRTGWPKSTIHAILSTMIDYGVVAQDSSDGKYRLGIRLFELGADISSGWNILEISRPYLRNIMLKTGESVNLGILDKGEVLIIEHIDSGNPLRVMMERGMRLPLHSSAMGKAMLAYLPQTQLKKRIKEMPFQAFTPHTITTLPEFETELDRVKLNGYAIENGEMRVGMRAVAGAIFNHQGYPVNALGITGMFRKISDENFIFARDLIVEACQQISRELGYSADS